MTHVPDPKVTTRVPLDPKVTTRVPLTKQQRHTFAAGFGGWTLDGFDALLFGLVLVPSLTELLTRSGIAATRGNIGFYGEIITAVFLAGWGCSVFWGPIADRRGRVPALMASLILYSVFTFLSGFTTDVWQLMICRFIAAIGTGAEWAIAGTLVAEAIPERRRVFFGGFLHSGFYIGGIVTSLVNYVFAEALGWRGMFMIGLIPALMVFYIRLRVREDPKMFREAMKSKPAVSLLRSFGAVLTGEYRRRTWTMVFLVAIALMGYWANTQYLTATAVTLARDMGYAPGTVRLLSVAVFALASLCTAIGCLIVPLLCQRLGRRVTLSVLFGMMILGILGVYAIALPNEQFGLMFVFVIVLGFGGSNFAIFTIWLPELYPTHLRATGFAFATATSRFLASAGTFLVGWGISITGSPALPLSLTAIPFLLGFVLVRMAPETRNLALPQ